MDEFGRVARGIVDHVFLRKWVVLDSHNVCGMFGVLGVVVFSFS